MKEGLIKPLIAVDLDDVLANYSDQLIHFHNKVYKTDLIRKDFRSYNLWEVWGGTKEEATRKVHQFHTTDYFKNIKPVVGARRTIAALNDTHQFIILTSRFLEIQNETQDWLNRHFPNKFFGMYFTNHWSLTGGVYKKKSDFCQELGAKIIIEDSLEYSTDCANFGIKALLLDKPWNQTAKDHPLVVRINSWREILQRLTVQSF